MRAPSDKTWADVSWPDLVRYVWEDWGTKVNYAARPYLEAMTEMVNSGRDPVRDPYYADSAGQVVMYFLSNASSWRGETAKAVKAEMKRRLKEA
jgi:hypothetical protein